MRLSPPRPAVWPVLLLLAGCADDPARLVQEINAAREGCTEEKLRAGAEECVRMFEQYAEMGTEAIHTYIGAMKALDQALQRMPPAQFDTAGLGRVLSDPTLLPPPDPAASPPPAPFSPNALPGYDAAPYPEAGGWDDAYRRDPYDRDLRPDPYRSPYADPRYRGGGYGGYDGYGGYGGWEDDPRYRDPRYPGGGYGGRYPPEGRYDPRREADPRYRQAPPPYGGLLPPEQRLDRPWLREGGDRRYDSQQRWRELPRGRRAPVLPDTLYPGERPPRYRREP